MIGTHLRVVSAALLVAGIIACSSRSGPVPRSLVPADAFVLLELRWSEVQANPALRQFAVLPRAAEALNELRVPIAEASNLIAFATPADSAAGTPLGRGSTTRSRAR